MASSESNITKDIYTMDVGRKKWVFPKRYFMNNDLLISNIPLHISKMKKATRQFCENYMLFENKSKQFGDFSKFDYMKFCSRPKRRSWSKRLKKLLESENQRNIHQHQQTEISIMFYFWTKTENPQVWWFRTGRVVGQGGLQCS